MPKESVVVPVIKALSDAERRVTFTNSIGKLLSFSLTIPFICAKVQSESMSNFIINILRILLLVFIYLLFFIDFINIFLPLCLILSQFNNSY